MRLIIDVPPDREHLLRRLDAHARRQRLSRSQIVLDALERHLCAGDRSRSDTAVVDQSLPTFHLGAMTAFRRADLYDEDRDT